MTVHGPERRGPERPGPDYPAEWDQEPGEEVEMCACGHHWDQHEQESLMGGSCYPHDSSSCMCHQFRPTSADLDVLRDVLRKHHPIAHTDTGPLRGCRCGQVKLGQDVIAHVVVALRAALDDA